MLQEAPRLNSLEALRRLRERGYADGKSAVYALVKQVRPLAAHSCQIGGFRCWRSLTAPGRL